MTMATDRRQRISLLSHEARRLAAEQRRAFLDAACGDDTALRREVESLIADETQNSDSETVDGVAAPGTILGSYRIERLLGRGGMGAVFLAHDTVLHRPVALKIVSAAGDGGAARARVLREARSAAALNHPNICTIYEVGDAQGTAFIAMEYVDGRSLRDRLDEGALPLDEGLRYALQAAGALAYAHDHSVVHHDFKAANAMLTRDGRVKIVDFGLARRSDMLLADVTTLASLTRSGIAAGTPYAMAPEQVRGEATDARTDVWSLGVLLYEMAAGAKPFHGATVPELFSSILRDPPADLAGTVPVALRALISQCLAKDPERRVQLVGDVRAAIDAIQTGRDFLPAVPLPESAPVAKKVPARRQTITRRGAIGSAGAALLVAAAGLVAWRLWPGGIAVRTLAVLPLENVAKDADFEYLCDGIADSLIRTISSLPSLKVNNLSSVLTLKGRTADPLTAGRQLGVETILAGRLQRDGPRLLISARLLDVATGRQLWTHDYNRDAAELLDVQDEIASAIMNDGLRVRLSESERQRLVRHPTSDGDAYDLYLQAGFLQRRATEEDYLSSRGLLERAVVRDPKFALAYASLSANYAMMVTDGLERPTDAWPQVNRYMRQALQIDPDLPEAQVMAHALAFFFDWDWAGAERARQRVLQTPVGDFEPQFLRAFAVERWALGRLDEALQLARRTRELDPRRGYLATLEADYLLRGGQLDAAAALYERASQLDAENPNSLFGLAETRSRQGRFDEALAARRKAHALAGDDRLDSLFATARGEPGYRQVDQAWVRLQLEALKERQATSYVSPLDFARVYAQLGEKELAFQYLDAAFADRSPGLVFLKVDPVWESVRADPRFGRAVQRVGLP